MKHVLELIRVMTPFPHTIEGGATLREAEKMLLKHGQGLLPVTTGEVPTGIVTMRDIRVAKICQQDPQKNSAGSEDPTPKKRSDKTALLTLKDLKLPAPYIVEPTEQLASALSHMFKEKHEAALVVRKGRVVGIFTYADAYNLLLRFMSGSFSLFDPPDISA